ncbi:helix-turn-helix transcriptional regulator [Gordonia insulae]|uniref:HTH-type transcriptional regulator n=1 Tax=Gordonia insulae TaxID=2420509 RepID=A0A3G8JRY1_9ACTN|nr:LuxR family transcriptional regulator [Gordonia insulae]AZG47871.1 Putative HTH-type transcriptional regulator [Gordonia insulae]
MTRPARAAQRRDVVAEFRSRLDELLAGVDDPSGVRCLMLVADTGAGKSRLLHEVTSGSSVPIGWATASELSWRQPYSVIADALGCAVPEPLDEDADQFFLNRLDDLAASGRYLIVVDDAHNADAASLNLLQAITDAARDLPLTLLVAARPLPQREYLTRLTRRPDVDVVAVPPMDAMDLDVLVRERHDAWPTTRLRDALVVAHGNPLHAGAILDELDRTGQLIRDGDRVDLAAEAQSPPAAGLADSIAARLDALDPSSHDVLVTLGIWGGPVDLGHIAALSAVPATALLGPAQRLLDAGVAEFDAEGRLRVVHDSIADVVVERTPQPLRAIVHRAIAEQPDTDPVSRAFHLRAAGAAPSETVAADHAAAQALTNAPAVHADLLSETGVGAGAPGLETQVLALERVLALARSGQLERADESARATLAVADDLDVIARLYRTRLFVLTARGENAEAIATIESLTGVDLPERSRRVLTDLHAYLTLLSGAAPIPVEPFAHASTDLTLTGLVAEALRSCLVGSSFTAVEFAAEASRRFMSDDSAGADSSEGASADLWPPFIEMFHGGPRAAADVMADTSARQAERGTTWQSTYRQLIHASILTMRGQLSDAAVTFDTAMEKVSVGDEAVPSLAYGARVFVDLVRGDLAAAERRVQDWYDGRVGHGVLVEQFGLPQIQRMQMLVLEARRRHRAAAEMAAEVWDRTIAQQAYGWAATIAPACARVAIRAVEPALVARIGDDLAALTQPLSPALAPTIRLARGMVTAEPAEMVRIGVEVAEAARDLDDVFLEIAGWEESAVSAAIAGDRTGAIDHARRALQRAEDVGADGVTTRILSRMRSAGVRVTTAGKRRPTSGWDSLTPTEAQVTELIAMGFSGPDIAARLFMSPRTVQTHVSHVLGKLGLRTRVELAAAASSRQAAPIR